MALENISAETVAHARSLRYGPNRSQRLSPRRCSSNLIRSGSIAHLGSTDLVQ